MHTQHVIQLVLLVVGILLIAVMVHWAHQLDDPMAGSPDGNIAQAYIALALSAIGAVLIGIAFLWFIIGGILGF